MMKQVSKFTLSLIPIGLLLFLLMNVPNMYETIVNKQLGYFLYGAACDFLTAIICAFIMKVVNQVKYIGPFLQMLIITWCSIMFFIISYSIIEGYPFEDIIAIILGTNLSEIGEFYSSQFALDTAIIVVIVFIVIIIVSWVGKDFLEKKTFSKNRMGYFLGIMLLFSSLLVIYKINNTDWTGHAYLRKCSILLEYENKPNLKDFYTNPAIEKVSQANIPNLVILIGESLSSDYSSLYGYDKKTQPLLESLVNDGNLFVFKNVVSPATSTLASFKQFMTTYRGKEKSEVEWYKSTTLIELLNIIGFKTSWLSNQTKFGFYDNTISSFVECCDTSYFCGNEFDGCNKKTYDGELLKHIDDFKSKFSNPHCLFVHFMGSHPVFKERYPDSFEKYSYLEYDKNLFDETRKAYAGRDNSILYNDYVVYNIMKRFEDNTVVVYFSDHGLDKDRHGKPNDIESFNNAIRIPFMLYLPNCVQQNNPQLLNKIKQAQVGEQYSTTNLLYTIMDILGYKFSNNTDVENYSILNRNQSLVYNDKHVDSLD